MSKFGSCVRSAREAEKLTQAALAEKVGVTREQISRVETGERDPSFELALALAKELAIDLNLLKEAPSPTEPLEDQSSQFGAEPTP